MSLWWNGSVKATVERKEAAWKEVLGAKGGFAKERFMEIYKNEKKKMLKVVYNRTKRM